MVTDVIVVVTLGGRCMGHIARKQRSPCWLHTIVTLSLAHSTVPRSGWTLSACGMHECGR